MRSESLKFVFPTILAALLLLSGCSVGKRPVCGDADPQWATNLALWRSQGIVDYDMVIQRFRDPMYGHVPFLIKVRNGNNVSLAPARENLGLEKTDGYEAVATVEEMFNTIKRACERGDNVTVEYDVQLGVPKNLGFSNIAAPVDAADGYKLDHLTPID
jgi:hypothetical protein